MKTLNTIHDGALELQDSPTFKRLYKMRKK